MGSVEAPTSEPIILATDSGEKHSVDLTDEEESFLRKLLVAHSLVHPLDKSLALGIRNKLNQ